MQGFGQKWTGSATAGAALDALTAALHQRHGSSVAAVLFYGSCLRNGDPYDGLVDLYVIVNGYRRAHAGRLEALANSLLPPNVYYLQTCVASATVRCKYAVLSMRDLQRAVSPRWFQSYVWGRFCQPITITYCSDAATLHSVRQCLFQACVTFLARVLPAVAERGYILQLWEQGLALSYATELRAERSGRAAALIGNDAAHYLAATYAAAPALSGALHLDGDLYRTEIPAARRRLAALAWAARNVQGKCCSILRLLKALFTFEGGLDYIAWKLERHSGRPVHIPERVRKLPLLFVWPFMYSLYRRGFFK